MDFVEKLKKRNLYTENTRTSAAIKNPKFFLLATALLLYYAYHPTACDCIFPKHTCTICTKTYLRTVRTMYSCVIGFLKNRNTLHLA